jgi:alpha-L-rhamnosidase
MQTTRTQFAPARRTSFDAAARITRSVAATLLVIGVLAPAAVGGVTVGKLRCEYRENPLGIDATHPRLSWSLAADQRGTRQTAYQVLVASSADKLEQNAGDVWDSGRVESDQSIQVRYDGRALASHAECFWKVRVWDQNGEASEWSEPAKWTMGLLDAADWRAQWIGLEGSSEPVYLSGTNWIWYPEGEPAKAVPVGERYFRRVFELPADRRVIHAEYLATADDQCKAYINGRDIGGRDNYRTVKQSDLTNDFRPGRNLIAITGMNKGDTPTPAAIIAILTVEFDRGDPLVLLTDGQWRSSQTADPGWNTELKFDDSDWTAAKVVGPAGIEPWGDVRAPENRRLPARWLRKEFDVAKDVHRATVSFCGLGLSELYLNGQKVGDHVLSPGATQYPERVFYVTYDVTDQLRAGENAIGVVLGNGRYYSMRSRVYAGMPHYGFPKLLLNLRIEHADGTVSEVVSDASWKLSADGPIVANNEYDGEEYDARKEFDRWSEVGFDDSAWRPAELVPPAEGALAAEMIEPIRVTETLRPIAITEPQPGVFIVDMGQNMVGWCRLTVSGPAGTEVRLRHAETLQPDGTLYLANIRGAKVTDIYTLHGSSSELASAATPTPDQLASNVTETWEPRFTYHGFRYVEITGFPGKPTLDSIAGRVVHDDVRSVGQFECSNPLLNQIYKNVVWGVRGNYRSLPTDCPQRDERQGWLGDRSEECKGETYLFDIAALYSKWLQDMEDSQKPSGSVPDVCPAHWPLYSDNVTWPSSTVIIPNMLRRQYGDERIIARHYDSAKRWVDYMLTFVEDGIIARDSYGDWCVPPEDPTFIHSKDPARITAKPILATSYFYHDLRLMEKYALMLGKEEDAQRFNRLAEQLSAAFNARFLNRELGQYDNGTQTSCVLPLRFGLVPEDQEQRIFDHLVHNIVDVTHSHIGTGLIGGQFLNQVLSDHGRADLSYTIASQEDYPGWGYMIANDATTIWELWNGNTADPTMNSHNHVMLVGDLVIWFYEYLAGIAPDDAAPGFKQIVMRPHPVGDLAYVKASFDSPHGLIESHWQKQGDQFDWRITVPANTTATLYVPATNADAVSESGRKAAESAGVNFVRLEGDRAVFRIGSGEYHFVSQ